MILHKTGSSFRSEETFYACDIEPTDYVVRWFWMQSIISLIYKLRKMSGWTVFVGSSNLLKSIKMVNLFQSYYQSESDRTTKCCKLFYMTSKTENYGQIQICTLTPSLIGTDCGNGVHWHFKCIPKGMLCWELTRWLIFPPYKNNNPSGYKYLENWTDYVEPTKPKILN